MSNLVSCSNTGPGTSALPFCSLQVGLDRAQPGDLVEVRGGAYGPAQLDVTASGTVTARIRIRSVPRRAAVIIGPVGAGDVDGTGVMITGSYIDFEGFEVRDSAGTGIRNLGNYVTIRDNYVHDNARRCDPLVVPKCGQGIASNGSTPRYGAVIERNLSAFNGTSPSQDHGYYISMPGAIVRNNIATGASAFGFQIYPNCDACLIYNNVANGNTRNSGFLIGGDGVSNFSTGVMAFNNISTGNSGYGFWIYNNQTATVVMRNNIVWGNTAGTVRVSGSDPPDNASMLQLDPLLVNPAGLDFHIRAGSPAINAGSPSYAPPDDIDGQSRVGLAVDIGVDEFSQAVPPEAAEDLQFINPVTLVWSISAQANTYDLYRGTMSTGPWLYTHVCLQSGLSVAGAIDNSLPPASSVWYYLVSGVNAAGEGGLGFTSALAPRPAGGRCL